MAAMKWLYMRKNANAGTEELSVNSDVRKILHPLGATESVNLVSIFGAARQGKSFLMNLLSGEENLFRISNSREPCTQGVDLASKFLTLEDFSRIAPGSAGFHSNRPSQMRIGFVDAEGQGDRDITYDSRLVSPVLLASKCVLFNWKDSLQVDRILNLLAVIARAAQGVDAGDDERKVFGHLHIIFRDWNFVDGTPESVFEDLFRKEKGRSTEVGVRNQARATLQDAFESITVWLFPPPVAVTRDLSEKIGFRMLQGPFVSKLQELRATLTKQLQQPVLFNGKRLTGRRLEQLMPALVDVLNSDEIILPEPIFASMLKAEAEGIKKEIISAMAEECSRVSADETLQSTEKMRELLDTILGNLMSTLEDELVKSMSEEAAQSAAAEVHAQCQRELDLALRTNETRLTSELQKIVEQLKLTVEHEFLRLEAKFPLIRKELDQEATRIQGQIEQSIHSVPAPNSVIDKEALRLQSFLKEKYQRAVSMNEKLIQAQKYEVEKSLRDVEQAMRKKGEELFQTLVVAENARKQQASPILLDRFEQRLQAACSQIVSEKLHHIGADASSASPEAKQQIERALTSIITSLQQRYLLHVRDIVQKVIRELKQKFEGSFTQRLEGQFPLSDEKLRSLIAEVEREISYWANQELDGWTVTEKDALHLREQIADYVSLKREHYLEKNQRLFREAVRSKEEDIYSQSKTDFKKTIETAAHQTLEFPMDETELKQWFQSRLDASVAALHNRMPKESKAAKDGLLSLKRKFSEDVDHLFAWLLVKNRSALDEIKNAELTQREQLLEREKERLTQIQHDEREEIQRAAATHMQQAANRVQALEQELAKMRQLMIQEQAVKSALMQKAEKEANKRALAEKAANDAARAAAEAVAAAEQAIRDASTSKARSSVVNPEYEDGENEDVDMMADDDEVEEKPVVPTRGRRQVKAAASAVNSTPGRKRKQPPARDILDDDVENRLNTVPAGRKETPSQVKTMAARKRGAAAGKTAATAPPPAPPAAKKSPGKMSLEEARAAAKEEMDRRIAERASALKTKRGK